MHRLRYGVPRNAHHPGSEVLNEMHRLRSGVLSNAHNPSLGVDLDALFKVCGVESNTYIRDPVC